MLFRIRFMPPSYPRHPVRKVHGAKHSCERKNYGHDKCGCPMTDGEIVEMWANADSLHDAEWAAKEKYGDKVRWEEIIRGLDPKTEAFLARSRS